MRLPQGRFDLLGSARLGEQEAEVAVALWQRADGPAGRDRDLEAGDVLDRAGLVLAAYLPQRARLRDRQHHHAGGSRLAPEVARLEPEGVAEDHLLERDAESEAERARAEAADRARGELEH